MSTALPRVDPPPGRPGDHSDGPDDGTAVHYAETVMSSDNSAAPAAGRLPSGGHAGDGPGACVDALVESVRRYRNAEAAMRGKSRDSMHLGKTDMAALRFLLRAGRSGRPLSAASLARDLEISTAATTVLIDRLEKTGHAERRPSATDRRAIEIWPTPTTDDEVRSTMGVLHERMMGIAGALSAEDRRTVRRFFESLGTALGELDFPDPVREHI
jgi:DNA-binding MarR family transcriptional regulator